ncbi:DNA repair protein RadC [Pasteurella testudinis DSM 23072]|uniref:DNA repair protein RadC n=1 Tax=Pasteurella testudinis DSM 23072 TaxID=1122938 RepID=A0A1W1UWM3_9PAST|nr:DNA repair protein RadC [Pasteurella testudinis]SMB85094.1 DNA repair protein RadC [Pasteurella testudinis DSM 23072]SUB52112.1 RuvA domain 2-like protein [Pasteurella testudinis]
MSNLLTTSEQSVINSALNILNRTMEAHPVYQVLSDPDVAKNYLKLLLGLEEREQFAVLFLKNDHTLIKSEILFSGSINSAHVYPREIIKKALALNAAAIMLAHNHPSGNTVISDADKVMTEKIKAACELIDIRVLDHIIIAGQEAVSFVEQQLL